MYAQAPLPKLVTFDGEARSGKGTIVTLVKDYLRDELGYKVMLIDTGQVFRVLVVALERAGVDLDFPDQIDEYLAIETNIVAAAELVKYMYRLPREEREALLYAKHISTGSAKIGARPSSQAFKDELQRKWLADAAREGCDVVLVDGRALEETGEMLVAEGLCDYSVGFYFVCDPVVSAQRSLGRMPLPYDQLDEATKALVDEMVVGIVARNESDRSRAVQPLVMPVNAERYMAAEVPERLPDRAPRPMAIIDRSLEVPLDQIAIPLARLIARYVA